MDGGDLTQGKVNELTFVLATYTINGSFVGYQNWTKQFQMCGVFKWEASKWIQ